VVRLLNDLIELVGEPLRSHSARQQVLVVLLQQLGTNNDKVYFGALRDFPLPGQPMN